MYFISFVVALAAFLLAAIIFGRGLVKMYRKGTWFHKQWIHDRVAGRDCCSGYLRVLQFVGILAVLFNGLLVVLYPLGRLAGAVNVLGR